MKGSFDQQSITTHRLRNTARDEFMDFFSFDLVEVFVVAVFMMNIRFDMNFKIVWQNMCVILHLMYGTYVICTLRFE